MIKFFRKIRQSLLMDPPESTQAREAGNKTGKPVHMTQPGRYLKYAIGEIVLVVIGILIALQINDWNEVRKESEIVKSSLTAMKSNIQEDIVDLNNQIDYNTILRKNLNFALKIIALPEYENKPLSLYGDSIGDITKT